MAFFNTNGTLWTETDWQGVYDKKMEPPFKPKVKGVEDTSNFDDEFLREPVVDSVVPPSQFAQGT